MRAALCYFTTETSHQTASCSIQAAPLPPPPSRALPFTHSEASVFPSSSLLLLHRNWAKDGAAFSRRLPQRSEPPDDCAALREEAGQKSPHGQKRSEEVGWSKGEQVKEVNEEERLQAVLCSIRWMLTYICLKQQAVFRLFHLAQELWRSGPFSPFYLSVRHTIAFTLQPAGLSQTSRCTKNCNLRAHTHKAPFTMTWIRLNSRQLRATVCALCVTFKTSQTGGGQRALS